MCGLELVSSSTILAQDTTAAATDGDGDGPEPPGHVKKRLTKKLHFLERVADSKRQALSATAGIRKKAHKSKHKQQKPLPDLSSLADLLAEVGQKQHQQAPEAGQGADGQPNKQKGRTEQITGSKARRAVTYVSPLLCVRGAFQTHATAFACIRLYSGIFIYLLLLLAYAGAITQVSVHFITSLLWWARSSVPALCGAVRWRQDECSKSWHIQTFRPTPLQQSGIIWQPLFQNLHL